MVVRLVRTVASVIVSGLGAYIIMRTLDGRRQERRLAAPVTAWPDVSLDTVVTPGRH